jgi:membrane-anchored protein YejM (alkaline phosphatase superfamily)
MYTTWLNEIEHFIKRMKDKNNTSQPFFSFNFLTEYTHNYLAIPWQFDLKLKKTLEHLQNESFLANTMLVIIGIFLFIYFNFCFSEL